MSSQDKLTARQLHKAITAGSAAALRCNTEGGAGAGADKRPPAADMVLQDVEDDPESPQAPRAGAAATTAPEAGKAETVFQAFDDWPCSAAVQPWQLATLAQREAKWRPPDTLEEARALFQRLIDQGDRDGHAGMGQLLAYGWGVARDPLAAFQHFQVAAKDMTHERGCAGVGQCYMYGWGTTVHYPNALRYLRLAASGYYGDPIAQYEIAKIYFHGNRGMARDYAEALKWMTWSAQKGFAPAQYALGVMYRAGTMPTSALTPPVATSLMESMEPSLRPKSPGRRQRGRAAREAEIEYRTKYSGRHGMFPERSIQWFAAAASQGHTMAAQKFRELGSELGAVFRGAYPVLGPHRDHVALPNPALGSLAQAPYHALVVPLDTASAGAVHVLRAESESRSGGGAAAPSSLTVETSAHVSDTSTSTSAHSGTSGDGDSDAARHDRIRAGDDARRGGYRTARSWPAAGAARVDADSTMDGDGGSTTLVSPTARPLREVVEIDLDVFF